MASNPKDGPLGMHEDFSVHCESGSVVFTFHKPFQLNTDETLTISLSDFKLLGSYEYYTMKNYFEWRGDESLERRPGLFKRIWNYFFA